jgi:hypothetical protein
VVQQLIYANKEESNGITRDIADLIFLLHRWNFQGTSDSKSKFRVDFRVPINSFNGQNVGSVFNLKMKQLLRVLGWHILRQVSKLLRLNP